MKKIILLSSLVVAFIIYIVMINSRSISLTAPIDQPIAIKNNSLNNPSDNSSDNTANNVVVVQPAPVASANTNKPANKKSSPALIPVQPPVVQSAPVKKSEIYADGEYIGDSIDVYYGNVQIKAIIANGKITDVQFLDYPNDRRNSIIINTYAMPNLKSEAIAAQNSQVDTISGATETSRGFRESLASALAQAKK